QPELTGFLAAVVDRHDVGMRQTGDDVCLAHEPGNEVELGREFAVEQLQRVESREPRVADQVYGAHAAGPERADHRVAGKHVAGGQRHGTSRLAWPEPRSAGTTCTRTGSAATPGR